MRQALALFFLILAMGALWGCQESGALVLPTPKEGTASIGGQVVDFNGRPVGSAPIRLAEVYRDQSAPERGAYVLDAAFSPGGITNSSGFFTISDVNPGEYVLVVGDVESNNYVVAQEDGKPKVWLLNANEALNVGVLKIRFPEQ